VVVDGQLLDLLDHELLLPLDDLADLRVVDRGVHVALHHRSSLVVLDVAFPPLGRHLAVLAEALLAEVSQGQVVGIGHQVLHLSPLHFLYIASNLHFNLFMSLVPNPLICSVEVMARKAISANRSCLNSLKQMPPTTLELFLRMIIDS
jgi:hypothetical protein